MSRATDIILQKCEEHVKSGGKIVSGFNGVDSILKDSPTDDWEFLTATRCCCPLGAVLAATEVQSGVFDEDAASKLDEEPDYVSGFMWGFDNMGIDFSFLKGTQMRGYAEGVEVRQALLSKGIEVYKSEHDFKTGDLTLGQKWTY